MKRNLKALQEDGCVQSYVTPEALSLWNGGLQAATDEEDERSISILDVITEDNPFGEGVSAKKVNGILRNLGPGPVTVNINSPGGSLFEGLTIYNLLKQHEGEITVNVLGIAASAASVVAMAGDNIKVAKSGFLMIHNCLNIAIGNRNDMRDLADTMETFDKAMAGVYADKCGMAEKDVHKMMDRETWLTGQESVEQGLANSLLSSDKIEQSSATASLSTARQVEQALRSTGMSRSESKQAISKLKSSVSDSAGSGERDATEQSERDAASFIDELSALQATLNNFRGKQ